MCGVIGLLYDEGCPVAADAYIGLLNLQHRGKEGAGVHTCHKGKVYQTAGTGEIAQAIPHAAQMEGSCGIGQTRYSTTGASQIQFNQPFMFEFRGRPFSIVHNGNIINLNTDNYEANRAGCSDTFLAGGMISNSLEKNFEDAVIKVIKSLKGSFVMILMYENKLYAVMDRFNFHPLVIGKNSYGYVLASETCVLDHLQAEYLADVGPGEFWEISLNGYRRIHWTANFSLKMDIFEFIYFSRPDSYLHGVEVGRARYYKGWLLAKEHPSEASIIMPIPDSANDASLGYYERIHETGRDVKFRPWAFFRPHIVSRTFIDPIQELRKENLNLKFNPRGAWLYGKEVLFVDDSAVRFNTQRRAVSNLRRAGVTRMHARISSPPYVYPDIYGVDTYRKGEVLFLNRYGRNIDKARKAVGLDSLAYLSLDNTIKAVLIAQQKSRITNSQFAVDTFYTGPFSGEYPDGTGIYQIAA